MKINNISKLKASVLYLFSTLVLQSFDTLTLWHFDTFFGICNQSVSFDMEMCLYAIGATCDPMDANHVQ